MKPYPFYSNGMLLDFYSAQPLDNQLTYRGYCYVGADVFETWRDHSTGERAWRFVR